MKAKHMRRQGINFECPLCNYTTFLRRCFKRHMTIHRQKKADIICSFCDKKFYLLKSLNYHIKIKHQSEDTVKRTCSLCAEEFGTEFKLHNHIKLYHPDEEAKFVCKICSSEFYTEGYMRHHVTKKHSTKVKCRDESCNAEFSNKTLMNNHFKTIHLKPKPENVS